jgi:ATP synthase protein I
MNQDPIDRLEDRLDKARAQFDQEYNPKPEAKDGRSMGDGARAGIELVGGLIGGGIIGFALDKAFDTSPILFFIFFILGFLTGLYNVYKINLGIGTSVGFKPLPSTPKNAKQGANFNDEDDDD